MPGQRMSIGTRYPPSQLVAFSPRNGVVPPSGKDQFLCAVVDGEDDDGIVSVAESVKLFKQLADKTIKFDHAVEDDCRGRSCLPTHFAGVSKRASALG